MRRILSYEEQQKRDKKRAQLLVWLMLLLLVGSTAGYAIGIYSEDSSSAIKNKEGIVEETTNGWTFPVGDQKVSLLTAPSAASGIDVQTSMGLYDYQGKVLYVDSTSDSIGAEIITTLGRFAERVQPACYGSCERNLPEVNCTENIIIWKESNDNKVYQQDKCVFIEGDTRAADAFLYRVFGIQ